MAVNVAASTHPDVDRLLDRLHRIHACGCGPDCGNPHLQGNRRTDGSYWLGLTLPDGKRIECHGKTVDLAAWQVLRSLPPLPDEETDE